jgi:hypothetical protein
MSSFEKDGNDGGAGTNVGQGQVRTANSETKDGNKEVASNVGRDKGRLHFDLMPLTFQNKMSV